MAVRVREDNLFFSLGFLAVLGLLGSVVVTICHVVWWALLGQWPDISIGWIASFFWSFLDGCNASRFQGHLWCATEMARDLDAQLPRFVESATHFHRLARLTDAILHFLVNGSAILTIPTACLAPLLTMNLIAAPIGWISRLTESETAEPKKEKPRTLGDVRKAE